MVVIREPFTGFPIGFENVEEAAKTFGRPLPGAPPSVIAAQKAAAEKAALEAQQAQGGLKPIVAAIPGYTPQAPQAPPVVPPMFSWGEINAWGTTAVGRQKEYAQQQLANSKRPEGNFPKKINPQDYENKPATPTPQGFDRNRLRETQPLNLAEMNARPYEPTPQTPPTISAANPQERAQALQAQQKYEQSLQIPKTQGAERIAYEVQQAGTGFVQSGLSTLGLFKSAALNPIGTTAQVVSGVANVLKDPAPVIESGITALRERPGYSLGVLSEVGVETAVGGQVLKAGRSALAKEYPALSSELNALPKGVEASRSAAVSEAVEAATYRYPQLRSLNPEFPVKYSEVNALKPIAGQVREAVISSDAKVTGTLAQRTYGDIFPKPHDADIIASKPPAFAQAVTASTKEAGIAVTASSRPESFKIGAGLYNRPSDKAVITPVVQLPFSTAAVAVERTPASAAVKLGGEPLFDIKSSLMTREFPFDLPTKRAPSGERVFNLAEQSMRKLFGATEAGAYHRIAKDPASFILSGTFASKKATVGLVSKELAEKELSILAKEYRFGKNALGFSEEVAKNPEAFKIKPDKLAEFAENQGKLRVALQENLNQQRKLLGITGNANKALNEVLQSGEKASELGRLAAKETPIIPASPRAYYEAGYSAVRASASSGGLIPRASSGGLVPSASSGVKALTFSSSGMVPRVSSAFFTPSLGVSPSPLKGAPSISGSPARSPSGRGFVPSGGGGSSLLTPPSPPNVPYAPRGGYVPKFAPPIIPNILDNKKKSDQGKRLDVSGEKKKKLAPGFLVALKSSPYKKASFVVLDRKPLSYEAAKEKLFSTLVFSLKRSGKLIPTSQTVEESARPLKSYEYAFRTSKRDPRVFVQKNALLTKSERMLIQLARRKKRSWY